jgi:ankyrin repeat protein
MVLLVAFVWAQTPGSERLDQTIGQNGLVQSATVDFARDVQPILNERCLGCHGPARQENGYRLDRRSGAFSGVVRPNIIRGSSESSPLFHRLAGNQRGPQMPPTGALPQEQIDTLKRWIDQGAAWPDSLANDIDLAPLDPNATRMIDAVRRSNRARVIELLEAIPGVVNRPGPRGSTPLMYAALYGDSRLVAEMIRAGGDPNLRNHAGATALMWAVESVDTARLLLDHGADANATSGFGRTPLMIAASQAGSGAVVRLLLDRGAKPGPTALASAATRGNSVEVRMLLAAGARDTGAAAIAALRSGCRDCFEAIVGAQELPPLQNAFLNLLPPSGSANADSLRRALDRGASVTFSDPRLRRTVLMQAAILQGISPEVVQLFLDRGAPLHDKTAEGLTALDFARASGNIPVAEALIKAGATTTRHEVAPASPNVSGNTVTDAVRRSLPLLQRTAVQFYQRSGCVSCHHNNVAQITVAAARERGFVVDEVAAREDVARLVKDMHAAHDQAVQGIVVPGGGATTTGYILIGLAAERHPADAATDALVRLLRRSQLPDGRWLSVYRPPIEASPFTSTAVSLRGIQLYGATTAAAANRQAIRSAASWLTNARPSETEDRVFRLLGLTWAGAAPRVRDSAVRDLVATQRPDGGWAQLTSLQSDAYATGEALVALSEAGMRPGDPVYRRGLQFLLTTQLADGSWFVRTRSIPTQAYFESGSPHGEHQFISAAATNWATLALVRSQPLRAAGGSLLRSRITER